MFISPLIDPFALSSVVEDAAPKLGGDLNGQSHSLTNMSDGTFSGTVTASELLPTASTSDIGSNSNRWDEIYADNLYIDADVGIGTIDPDVSLDVRGTHVSGVGIAKVEGNSGSHAYLALCSPASGKQAGQAYQLAGTSKWLLDYVTASDCLRYYSYTLGDNVLELYSDGHIEMDGTYNYTIGGTNHALYIDSDGKIGKEPSGIEHKENIRELDGSERVFSLRPVRYDRKDGSGANLMGLIAEEVYEVMPEVVLCKRVPVRKKVVDEVAGKEVEVIGRYELTNIPESVDYTKLIPPLIVATQLLKARIDDLEARAV